VLFKNDAFKKYLLQIARAKLSETTGIQLDLRDFSINLSGSSITIDMFDVTIDGAPPFPKPPILMSEHVRLRIQIVSLIQRKWYLKEFAMHHPVVHIFVDKYGHNNLPMLKDARLGASIVKLGIRRFVISNGELYYNDKKSALDADVHDLSFQAAFHPDPSRYSGWLKYSDGNVRFRNLNPMIHTLEAEFEATPQIFTVTRSLITTKASELKLRATLHDYNQPRWAVTYLASLDTRELKHMLRQPMIPAGVVKIAGSATYNSGTGRPVTETLRLEGHVSSQRLQVRTAAIQTLVRDISARYVLQHGNLELHDLRAALFGGRMNGFYIMRDIRGRQQSELRATVNNVALPTLQTLIEGQIRPANLTPVSSTRFRLSGKANLQLQANWTKTLNNLTAHVDASTTATVIDGAGPAGTTTPNAAMQPVQAEIHADYSATDKTISFANSYLRTLQTALQVNGTLGKGMSLEIQAHSDDLSEVEAIADKFGAIPQPLGLGGIATFKGTVQSANGEPRIAGQLTAKHLRIKETEWRTAQASVELSPSQLTLRNGSITPAKKPGQMTFNISLGLDEWKFQDTNPFNIDAHVSRLSVTDLRNLAGVRIPATGVVSASISLRGSRLSPFGRGTVTFSGLNVAGEPIPSAGIEFYGTGDAIRTQVLFRLAGGTVQSNFLYFPKRKMYEGNLRATSICLDQLRALRSRNLIFSSSLDVNAYGKGSLDNPGLQLTAQIPQVQIQNQTISGIVLQADIADRVAKVTLESQSKNFDTFVRGRGQISLTGDYQADVAFETSPISIRPLIALYFPRLPEEVQGQTQIKARLSGPLKDRTRLDAQVSIPVLTLSYKNTVQLAAAEPIQLEYKNGVLNLQKTAIRGTATDLQLQGTIPLARTSPISIVALGTLDLSLIQTFDPDITSSGQLQFNVGGTGSRTDPNVQGQIRIVNATISSESLPVGVQNGNGVLTLTGNRLEVQTFESKISGGRLAVTGAVVFKPSLQFNLALTGTGIRTMFPEGVREGMDADLILAGSRQSAVLRGQVRLTELSFSPAFDFNEVVANIGNVSDRQVPSTGFARNLNLDIHLVSTSDLDLVNSKLSLQGSANVRVRGTIANPAAIGRVNITGGDLIFRGNRYLLDPSTIDFVDPYRIEPRLNLALNTKVQDYEVRMRLRGTVDRLRTTYSSDPPLPPSDIINLIVFGKRLESQTTPGFGNLGAQSLIASSVSQQVTNRIEQFAGISQILVDPVFSGNLRDPGVRITVQQRVTGNLFVTYATDGASTQRQMLKVEYQATPRLVFSGIRDQNGGFAFDVRIKRNW
jgi:translocation and assembly module TamB